jgi:hypothetical protein
MKFPPILCAFLVLLFSACSHEQVPSIAREDLQTLQIGALEDQLDLFNLEGNRNIPKTAIAMRGGLFYISNGNGKKIVHYTSYGDLLFMVYNEETNPPPLSLRTNIAAGEVVTRWAHTYPLLEPGAITVDFRKHIYVEDRLPYERHSRDNESHALLDSLVLHFDETGRFVEYLGQEGVGGTPFPRINGVYTSVADELAVVCRLPTGWNVYWFDAEGFLLYAVHLRNDRIPIPQDRSEVFPSVDTVMASPDGRRLFIKVDYYRNTFDESTNTRSGAESDGSVIWVMDVENSVYIDSIEVPFFEYAPDENGRRTGEKLLYSMLGVIKNNRVFLSFPVDGGYSLLILAAAGGTAPGASASGSSQAAAEQRRAFIRVDNEELQFNTFNVSEDGILSGLLATDNEARLVWWRTDRLAGELIP